MAVTQHDSIFQSIRLPGGISTKATEFKDLAAKGDRWESPVFGIGSAKESSDIPKLAAVTRKPHNAASGGVRGGSGLQSSGGNFSSPGYGQDTNAASHGYNQGVGASAAGVGSPGYASTNGNPAGGFGNQVDQAFGMKDTQAVNGTPGGVHSAVTAQ
jgi:hypothetical protein